MTWLTDTPAGAVLTVRVTPRSSKTAVAGARDDCLLIRLQAPPVDGKANKVLLAFLADALDVPKSSVRLVGGDKSRVKRILVVGRAAAEIAPRLA